MKIKLDHINLTVHDINQSINWYEKVFGFKLVEKGIGSKGQPWAIVAENDSMIVMNEFKDRSLEDETRPATYHKIYHFGIRVSDVKTWERTVKENNMALNYGDVVQYPHSRSWYVRDPSGHEIEVSYTEGETLRFPGM